MMHYSRVGMAQILRVLRLPQLESYDFQNGVGFTQKVTKKACQVGKSPHGTVLPGTQRLSLAEKWCVWAKGTLFRFLLILNLERYRASLRKKVN